MKVSPVLRQRRLGEIFNLGPMPTLPSSYVAALAQYEALTATLPRELAELELYIARSLAQLAMNSPITRSLRITAALEDALEAHLALEENRPDDRLRLLVASMHSAGWTFERLSKFDAAVNLAAATAGVAPGPRLELVKIAESVPTESSYVLRGGLFSACDRTAPRDRRGFRASGAWSSVRQRLRHLPMRSGSMPRPHSRASILPRRDREAPPLEVALALDATTYRSAQLVTPVVLPAGRDPLPLLADIVARVDQATFAIEIGNSHLAVALMVPLGQPPDDPKAPHQVRLNRETLWIAMPWPKSRSVIDAISMRIGYVSP